MGGQIIGIRLPKMGISAEICAGLGRDRNCLGVLLVTEPPTSFDSQYEAVYSVCAPEDKWDFWTGFEVAASRLLHPHISYPLLISQLRPLVEAALRDKNFKSWTGDLFKQLTAPPTPPSIIPADLKHTTLYPRTDSGTEMPAVTISEWNGGAYCTGKWISEPKRETGNGGCYGKTRREAFGRWVSTTWGYKDLQRNNWEAYYAAFPQDRKGSPR